MLGRLAPGLKGSHYWLTKGKVHDEQEVAKSTVRRAQMRGRAREDPKDVEETGKSGDHAELTWHYNHWMPLRDVSRVSSTAWGMPGPTKSLQGTEQHGVAASGEQRFTARCKEHRRSVHSGAQCNTLQSWKANHELK